MNPKIERKDNIEVRPNKDDSVDEIIYYNDTGRFLYHLEQMSEDSYWMRFQGITQDLVVNFGCHLVDGKPEMWSNYEWEDTHIQNESNKLFAAPDPNRRQRIADLIADYGLGSILNEIAFILEKGRRTDHDLQLSQELQRIQINYVADDVAYWKEQMRLFMESMKGT